MCISDYQFRHPSALKHKICRRFIFRTLLGNERVFLVDISQFEINGYLALCEILLHLNKKGLCIKNSIFHLPEFNITIEAGDRCLVPFNVMNCKDVLFQIWEAVEEDDELQKLGQFYLLPEPQESDLNMEDQILDETLQSNFSNDEAGNTFQAQIGFMSVINHLNNDIHIEMNDEKSFIMKQNNISKGSHDDEQVDEDYPLKKTKNLEKTVNQALTKVKEWRYIHQIANLSLTNAAKFVKLSKKTLDDYFLVIRVGETLGYDFKENMNEKIGHLRHFIKTHPMKVSGRLPKRIISFLLIPDPNLKELLPCYSLNKMQFIQQEKL